jgi:uncharacterized protein
LNAKAFAPYSDLATALLLASLTTDGAHDTDHLARVWRNARAIQVKQGGDLEILAAAVLLHDCVAVPKDSPLRSHASRLTATEETSQLRNLGWGDERIVCVASAIESHSYSAGIAPTSLEARIMQDADRLDAIGYTGIARCFYTAGRMGSSLYEALDPRAKHRTLDDASFCFGPLSRQASVPGGRFQNGDRAVACCKTAQGRALLLRWHVR